MFYKLIIFAKYENDTMKTSNGLRFLHFLGKILKFDSVKRYKIINFIIVI